MKRRLLLLGCLSVAAALYLKKYYQDLKYEKDRIKISKLIRSALRKKPFLGFSAVKLAKMIKEGSLLSETITTEFINQIKSVEPIINSLTDERFEDAILEARSLDSYLSSMSAEEREELFEKKPLFGVPFMAKECFEIPGMNFTAGMVDRKGVKGEKWNPIVWRITQSGGILLGTGNLSEACLWYESFNKVYGWSNNPYDPSRSAGGSSGGGCAIVAALGAPFALTSDVGGSTRIPALFNGLFGHKTTGGAATNVRTWPPCIGKIERFCQMGVASRHSEDLLLVQSLISSGPLTAEEKAELEIGEDEHLNADLRVNIDWKVTPKVTFDKETKVIVLTTQPRGMTPTRSTDGDQKTAQRRVIEAFKRNGNKIEFIDLDLMKKAFDLWGSQMFQGEPPEHCLANKVAILKGEDHWALWEVLKHTFSFGTLSSYTLPLVWLILFDYVGRHLKPDWLTEQENRDFKRLKEELYEILGTPIKDGKIVSTGEKVVLLAYSLPTVAPKHGPLLHSIHCADVAATAIYNVLELPATAVPLGLGCQKVPSGVQIVGGHGKDVLCLSTAEFLQNQGVCHWSLPALN